MHIWTRFKSINVASIISRSIKKLTYLVTYKLKRYSINISFVATFIHWLIQAFIYQETKRILFFFSFFSPPPDDDFAPAGLTLFHRESVNWKSGTKTSNRIQKHCWEFLNGSQLFWLSFPSMASTRFAHLSYLLSRSLIVITSSENDFLAFAIRGVKRSLPYLSFITRASVVAKDIVEEM